MRASRAAAPSDEVRLAIIGLGDSKAVGGVGGRGLQLIALFRAVLGVRIVALCDVDSAILNREVAQFKARGETVAAYSDLRRVMDDKSIDAVVIAAPNHWHALATIWACQAGKDVYVEKPFSYNILEGRQMLAAARKYGRMVQVGTQRRSSLVLQEALDYVRGGALGSIRLAHAIVYRARDGIGKVDAPTPPPATVDFDLWSGPAQLEPIHRRQLHYDWHWVWSTGNGEMGNNGAHQLDVARWALGQDRPAPRAMAIGGRLGFDDDGQTANTHIALLDYRPAPLICEIRNYRAGKDAKAIGKYRGIGAGVVIDCEGGSLIGDATGCGVLDKQGAKIKEIKPAKDQPKSQAMEPLHVANFIEAVRSRKAADLHAPGAVGHATAVCCHMANLSLRLGQAAQPEAIAEATRGQGELTETFDRCRDYLLANGIDLHATPATLGPWLTLDADTEQFIGEHAARANELSERRYREPFVVPKLA